MVLANASSVRHPLHQTRCGDHRSQHGPPKGDESRFITASVTAGPTSPASGRHRCVQVRGLNGALAGSRRCVQSLCPRPAQKFVGSVFYGR